MLDTHILRPFGVDVARKLLVEYHVECRLQFPEGRLQFLALDSPALRRLLDRRNRLGTDSVEYIECLNHWLGSGIVAGVSTAMSIDGLIVIDD